NCNEARGSAPAPRLRSRHAQRAAHLGDDGNLHELLQARIVTVAIARAALDRESVSGVIRAVNGAAVPPAAEPSRSGGADRLPSRAMRACTSAALHAGGAGAAVALLRGTTMESVFPHVPRIGTVIANRYRVTDLLGVGSTGSVYRADDLQ